MDSTKLTQINALQADKAQSLARHEDLLASTAKVSDTVLSATSTLISYLEGHVAKAEVVNQLESINTPDVKYVVEALQVLDTTLKSHENTDLTEITSVMRELLEEAKALPKDLPVEKDQQFIDYTAQLTSLGDAIKAVEQVVKAQKLVAEAPIVNVPEANIQVDAPDLAPLQTSIKAVVTAVNKIVIPEFKTDNTGVEKLLKQSNKLLDKILSKPVGGGGGGGSSWPAVGTSGNPAPLVLDEAGGLVIAADPTANAIAQAVYDALTRLAPPQNAIPYARTINDEMRVVIGGGASYVSTYWANANTATVYYSSGAPTSVDAREQLELQSINNFNQVRSRWVIT